MQGLTPCILDSVQKLPGQIGQERMGKEHHPKGDGQQQIQFPVLLPSPAPDTAGQQKAQSRSKRIGDQIIHIRGPEGQDLQQFNGQRKAEAEKDRPLP